MASKACAHTGGREGLVGQRLAAAMRDAVLHCEAVKARLTKSRRRVLEMLLQADRPQKAYDLIAQFYDDRLATPPTVYRALEFLERQGLVHRIPSLNAYAPCRDAGQPHVAAFLICDCCHGSTEIVGVQSMQLSLNTEAHGFRLRRVAFEAHGLCAACAPPRPIPAA